jgi:hypothetical protein
MRKVVNPVSGAPRIKEYICYFGYERKGEGNHLVGSSVSAAAVGGACPRLSCLTFLLAHLST